MEPAGCSQAEPKAWALSETTTMRLKTFCHLLVAVRGSRFFSTPYKQSLQVLLDDNL